jgi:hypothetical protein
MDRDSSATLANTRRTLQLSSLRQSPIGSAAQACKWRNGSINDPQDVPEGDAFGGQEKIVPAEPTAVACKYPMMLELHQNLLEKWAWNLLALGNLARAQRTPGASKCDESMKSVFGSLRDHESLVLFSKISI